MSCTAHCCAIDDAFDSKVARREIQNFRRRGPSPSTRRLLDDIQAVGISGATVLDVGGGIGAIAHSLLDTGAAQATVVDASSAYLAAANQEATRRGTASRLTTIRGDVVELAGGIPRSDIVTLDKVVCCYPDMERLLAVTTDHADRWFGIVYPRDNWLVRFLTSVSNALRRMRNTAFRVYIFRTDAIQSRIRSGGFTLRTQRRGWVWISALYERRPPPAE